MTCQISIFARLQLLFTLVFGVLPRAALRVPGAIVCAWLRKLPVGPSIWCGFAGSVMDTIPPAQLQAILPSTFDTYNAWMLAHGQTPQVDVLPGKNSTRLLWLGPHKAKKVVLFFHGGGYVMPLSDGHLDWMAHVKNGAANSGIELSVCILEYSALDSVDGKDTTYTDGAGLVPTNPYPRQMMQGISALKHLFASKYRPSDIVFGGDSAGGHLSLSILAHLHRRRPSEAAESVIGQCGPVKGCFLVSPLSSLDLCTPSYKRWFSADVLSRKVVNDWGMHLVGNSPWKDEISAGHGWGMALDVPDSWWEGLDAVQDILVTGGYEEVFSNHIEQLAEMLKRNSNGEVTLHMANESHDGPLMDFAAARPPSGTTNAITDFVISCFRE